MPKKKKSKKTNPRKSFQTAKVGAGEGSDVSNNITDKQVTRTRNTVLRVTINREPKALEI